MHAWEESAIVGSAASGQKNVTVADASIFEVDDYVGISDENGFNNWESNQIAAKPGGNVLTMVNNLSHSYSDTLNGYVSHWIPSTFSETGTAAKPAFVLKDDTTLNFIKDFLVTIGSDPVRVIDQAVVFKKDITAGGFLGANQGCLFLGYGLNHSRDPPRITLLNYASGWDTLHLFGLSGTSLVPAHLATGNHNPLVASTYGLGEPANAWLGAVVDTLYVTAIRNQSGALYPLVASELGQAATDADGDDTITFNESYDNAPYVYLQGIDASARGIVLDVVSVSTTQCVVKAYKTIGHKHVIGSGGATSAMNLGISSDSAGTPAGTLSTTGVSYSYGVGDGIVGGTTNWIAACGGTACGGVIQDHYHDFSGGAAADITHDHGSHGHTFSGAAMSAHGHSLTNAPTYYRTLYLRESDGTSHTVLTGFINASKASVTFYTEGLDADDVKLSVSYNYLVFPA